MTFATFLTFIAAYAIAVASPGPGITAVVARGLGGGFKGAFPMVLGLVLGDLVMLAAAVFGLAALAKTFGAFFVVVRFAGASYLLYLAYKLWTTQPDPEAVRAKAAEHWSRTMIAGVSLTLGNPKVLVFYLALLPTLVPIDRLTMPDILEIAAIVVVVLTAIGCAYAAAASGAREMLKSPRALRRVNRVAGTMMAGAAAAVIAR